MQRINIKDIKVKNEYLNLVPRMKPDDEKAFEESIKQNGIQEPLTLNQDYILLDGHSRYSKAKKFEYKQIPFKIKKFTDKLLEKKYVIECNLARRHLTNFQKVMLGIPLLEIESKLAKQRMSEGGKGIKVGSNDPTLIGKSSEKVAKRVGVSNTTLIRGKAVLEKGTPEQKKKLEDGKTSINTIYNEITRKQRNLPKVELPVGKWSVCLVDLPIQFNNKGVRGSSSNNYDTIPIPELKLGNFNGKNIKDLFSDDCIIFAWFQASTIFEAKDILASWGFECKTNIVWNKTRIGTGHWLKNKHEHLVIATKGKIPLPAIRPDSIQDIEPENRKHSSKPTKFYELIEKMYPNYKYLDLFSRYKHNDNWTCFGNEFESDKQ